ncbi:hypothetical protein EJB05_57451 [Eragrostis curvula]|uniref:non-specific serine/threonine protein kinase n=1 Tax=Eragrostis curvula TaxID=38414 RepID=A0A5J9SDD7_9POAL|nr:hypothetical protein EJB05_57451 [Eragrostis curvula]
MMGALQQVQQSNGDGSFSDPGYVEVDPTGRYGRYNEVLGKGSSKTVCVIVFSSISLLARPVLMEVNHDGSSRYRAFDEHLGMEVAWNQVQLHDFLRSPGDLERLYGEIHLLKSLRHRAVMRLHASWVDAPRRAVNFVTELFTSGTLRQYRLRHRRGIKPAALHKVSDPAVRRFIERCLAPAARRPSAVELLNDPFLQLEDDGFSYYGDGDYNASLYNYLHQPALIDDRHHGGSNGGSSSATNDDDRWGCDEDENDDDDDSKFQGIATLFDEHEDDEHVDGVDISIKGKRIEDGSIFLRLRITDKNNLGLVRNIYFPFHTDSDTALSVATEMVGELDITDHEVTHIAEMIDGQVAALLPHWRPGPGMSDDEEEEEKAGTTCRNCRSSASSGGSLDDYMSAAARRGCRCAEVHGRFEEITVQADEEQVQCESSGCSSDD